MKKIAKGFYVAFVWIYGIVVIGYLAELPPFLILDYLTEVSTWYYHITNIQFEGFIGMVIAMGVTFIAFSIPFLILYIPVVILLILPVVWLT